MSPNPDVESGVVYLVPERGHALSDPLFQRLVGRGTSGLVITRQHPERVKHERDLRDTRIIWLAHGPGEGIQNPSDLDGLANLIHEFIADNHGEGVVLFDGLEYLLANNGFPPTAGFVRDLTEFVARGKAVVLIPIEPSSLTGGEWRLLIQGLVEGLRVLDPSQLPDVRSVSRTSRIPIRSPVLLVPRTPDLLDECRAVCREFSLGACEVDESTLPLDDKIREGRIRGIPFVVVVSGGETRSRILYVIRRDGREAWMTIENVKNAMRDLPS
jgi:hypothetical protein